MARKTTGEEKPKVVSYERQKSPKLDKLKKDLFDENKKLLFVCGLPSTGKTIMCLESAMEQICNGRYSRLIIAREVIVPKFGMLPGSSHGKMMFHTRQAEEYVDKCSQFSFQELVNAKKIEVIPTDQLQGMRFQNAIVFLDEAQNISQDDTFAILSRRGEDSKFLICGDTSKGQQSKKLKDYNILNYCIGKFKSKPYVGIHRFYDTKDILGDDVTRDIIITLLDDFM